MLLSLRLGRVGPSSAALRPICHVLSRAALAFASAAALGADPAAAQGSGFFSSLFPSLSPKPRIESRTLPDKPLKLTPASVPKPAGDPQEDAEAAKPKAAPPALAQGTARPSYVTMCVRLCDGYYFPISSPTRPADLRKDSELCESTCAVPAKLFVQYSFGGSAAQMRALDGSPYKKLKTAFLYRKKVVPNCTCRPDPWSEAELARHDEYAMHEETRRLAAELEAELAAASAIEIDDGSFEGALEPTVAEADLPPLPLELPVTKDGPNPPAVRVVTLTPRKAPPPPQKPRIAVIKVPPRLSPPKPAVPQAALPEASPPRVVKLASTKSSPGAAGAALTSRKKLIKDPRQLTIQHR